MFANSASSPLKSLFADNSSTNVSRGKRSGVLLSSAMCSSALICLAESVQGFLTPRTLRRKQKERKTERQTEGQTGRGTDRKTDRRTD